MQVIYDYRYSPPHGEIFLAVGRTTKVLYGFIRGLGSGLVVAGVAGLLVTFWPIVSAEVTYRLNPPQEKVSYTTSAFGSLLEEAQAEEERTKLLAEQFGVPNTEFSAYIPRIGAKATIVANVDPSNESDYKAALIKGVAHAQNSSYPGQNGGTYLFAHSTDSPLNFNRYNAVFYLLNELKSEDKDEIYIFFLNKVYKYRITEKHVVDADDVSWLTNTRTGPQRLILQTCWPPGTTWKRLVVIAYPAT
ncbi:MAG: sortase [Candidatus Blackburnbacteria bacterium]|nr:sortase [Candidatus Blackburnbacteria bacterium]